MIVGISEDPQPPQNIQKINSLSSSSSIYVTWDPPVPSNIDIDGYKLYMDDGLGGEFNVIYDGSQNP